MTDKHLPRMMGNAAQTMPLKIAERAITLASQASKTSKERFMLQMGADRRVWMDRFSAGEVNPREWVATFTRASDPDFLAEQIEYAARS